MKYVPMTDANERLLQHVRAEFAERGEIYSENRVLRMALYNLLGTTIELDNENSPAAALPPEALSLSSCSGEGEPAGL